MNVHEYQAKGLLREFGVAVPDGRVAATAGEAEEAARSLGGGIVVVKAQVHAGGRGKAGGIKLVKSPSEAKQAASEILGMTLRTAQTGTEGKVVRKVYVEAGSDIARELYLGVPCVLGAGGVERVLEVEMTADERKLFDGSVEHVRSLVEQISL